MTRPPWLGAEPTPTPPGRGRPGEVPDPVRQLVYGRAGVCCESCGRDLHHGDRHLHHRRPRAMGGSRLRATHHASNLLLLCPGCHDLVETHRTQALDAGLLLRQGADPARVPVLLHNGRYRLLTDGGEYLNPDEQTGPPR